MARALVDQVILVDEAEIAGAIRHAYAEERQIVEGGAAVGIAALLREGKVEWGPTEVLLSGGNIDMDLHRRIVGGENPDLLAERQDKTSEEQEGASGRARCRARVGPYVRGQGGRGNN